MSKASKLQPVAKLFAEHEGVIVTTIDESTGCYIPCSGLNDDGHDVEKRIYYTPETDEEPFYVVVDPFGTQGEPDVRFFASAEEAFDFATDYQHSVFSVRTYCDHCGDVEHGGCFVPYEHLPVDISSACAGESGVLCPACHHELSITMSRD